MDLASAIVLLNFDSLMPLRPTITTVTNGESAANYCPRVLFCAFILWIDFLFFFFSFRILVLV